LNIFIELFLFGNSFMNNCYDYICWVHICCCWWLYMLCAYMLFEIIYVVCIYVVGDDICNVHICCWYIFIHAIGDEYVGVSMNWNMLVWTCGICMKYVLLWSSPSSHTLLLLAFISNCCCWILMYSLCGLLWCVYMHQGRRPRRWKNWYHTY